MEAFAFVFFIFGSEIIYFTLKSDKQKNIFIKLKCFTTLKKMTPR